MQSKRRPETFLTVRTCKILKGHINLSSSSHIFSHFNQLFRASFRRSNWHYHRSCQKINDTYLRSEFLSIISMSQVHHYRFLWSNYWSLRNLFVHFSTLDKDYGSDETLSLDAQMIEDEICSDSFRPWIAFTWRFYRLDIQRDISKFESDVKVTPLVVIIILNWLWVVVTELLQEVLHLLARCSIETSNFHEWISRLVCSTFHVQIAPASTQVLCPRSVSVICAIRAHASPPRSLRVVSSDKTFSIRALHYSEESSDRLGITLW